VATILATVAALVGTVTAGAATANAAENPYERGPDPTEASVEAPTGPFAYQRITVPSGNGFGGGTIYAPTDTSQGTFGAVAISPGFTETQSAISWYGPRLASQGFVVLTIDTNGLFDQPDSRGQQLLAALDYLTTKSSVATRIDATRLGVMGHSMGGGGTLKAANDRPSLQAAIPLAAWHTNKNWSGVRVPTLIVVGENDAIASPSGHSEQFYESLPASLDKAYLEMAGADHFVTNSPNTTIAKVTISWLKRFIDNDTRYEQFLCPAPTESDISEYRDTCPHS
jgi:alpha-beta hydrolase superfamily lysophospholipase